MGIFTENSEIFQNHIAIYYIGNQAESDGCSGVRGIRYSGRWSWSSWTRLPYFQKKIDSQGAKFTEGCHENLVKSAGLY